MSHQTSVAADADPIDDLLLQWQQRRQQGTDVTPEELCAGRTECLDEVRRRISAIRTMEALLEVGSRTADYVMAPRRDASSLVFDPPGYEILGILGHGGMGIVYKARQLCPDRLVAIKTILAGAQARPDQLGRFRTEVEAIARLRHPNIVPIYEVSQCHDLPYFSMEYLEGGNLAQQLDKGPLPAPEAATLMRTLADAVQFAHDRGVVHRDLKPANVLLSISQPGSPSDSSPTLAGGGRLGDAIPKITDFGLAKRLDGAPGQTESGAVLGTPCYLAPEQAEGKTQEIGPAADVYALGAILYECLTGRPPFQGESTLDTLEQVRSCEPLPPSRLQPKIPRDLETVCLKCLQKPPAKRYASAADLSADLARFLSGEPIRARRTPLWEQIAKWAKRKPALATLALVIVAAVVGLLSLWAGFTAALKDQRDRAQHLEGEARHQAQIAWENKQAADRERAEAQEERDLVKELNSYTQRLLLRCQEDVKWHIDATLEGKRQKAATGDPHALLYVLARSYAMTAAAYRKDSTLHEADRNKQADYYASNAVDLLRRAWEMGYFASAEGRLKLKDDKDLAELRPRSDFRELLQLIEKKSQQ
jgi:serine/threonine protein kinase